MAALFVPKIDYSQFKGTTLILPVVSVGNVGQLAADLLIASLGLKRVAILDPSCLIPVAGPREDGEEGVTTPLEVYGKSGCTVYVIQQRSPAISAMKEQFAQQLTSFVREAGFKSVLLLTGVDVLARTDRHMGAAIYNFLSTNTSAPFEDRLTLTSPPFTKEKASEPPFIPGGGLTRRLLAAFKSASIPSLSAGVLLHFVMEGDNREDARVLAERAAKVADVAILNFKEPPSWRFGLFGTPQDQTLYG